ncbi:MAG: hypothetical protein LAT84_00830, partial [Balneolia bacterium]|nr:hypothetical protein [Balneolia bacterium]
QPGELKKASIDYVQLRLFCFIKKRQSNRLCIRRLADAGSNPARGALKASIDYVQLRLFSFIKNARAIG